MVYKAIVVAALAAMSPLALADNNDMVIFIHGFTRNSNDFQYGEELASVGFDSGAVDVNTFASDWNRACEAYAQIMGTQVDYGVCHSEENNQRRFGTDYTGKGLYPEWSEDNHIHLMGHSQGGITSIWLQQLMELGSGCPEDTSPLFTGGKSWITSITTYATPFQGSDVPINNLFPGSFNDIQFQLLKAFATRDNFGFPELGLEVHDGETFDHFLERVEKSGFFDSDKFAFNGMSARALANLHAGGRTTFDGTYYFAFAAERTSPEERCNVFGSNCEIIEVPDPEMSFLLKLTGGQIGRSDPPIARANDGIVSQAYARCPDGVTECIEVQDGDLDTWKAGAWHYVDIGYLDHLQIVQRDNRNDDNNYEQSAKKLWTEQALRLKSINSRSAPTTRVDSFERSEMAAAVRRQVEARRFLSQEVEYEDPEVSGGAIFGVVVACVAAAAMVSVLAVKGVKKYKNRKTNVESKPDHYALNNTL